jgi:hypothetical protein
MHVLLSIPVAPALHLQTTLPVSDCECARQVLHTEDAAAAAVAENLPAAQSVHAAAPGSVLYFPGAHETQVWPSGPVYPALHTHASGLVLAALENESGRHDWHCNSAPITPARMDMCPFQSFGMILTHLATTAR